MHIDEGKANKLFLARKTMFYLPHTPPTPPQLIYFPFLILLFIFNFHPPPPPPPPHFYCFPIIMLRLSNFKSQTSLTLLLGHYELINENVSYFLTNQSKTKTFIDLKVTRKPKPTKNSRRPYLYEIPVHFTHEIKTKGYDVIGVDLFHFKLMRFHFKKTG